jgi:hypothetical protein
MDPDVTITITTAGKGARGPAPEVAAGAEGQARQVSGPTPLPLDQLPPPGTAGVGADAVGGLPVPMAIETVMSGAAGASAGGPVPTDVGLMDAGSSGPPIPGDLDTLITARKPSTPARRRTRKPTR